MDIFKTLLAHNLVQPQDPSKFRIPDPKPHWWDEKAFCVFHNGIGHDIENCFKLKHLVQDLIESGGLQVDGLTSNSDHKAFKEPLPKYEKGEVSTNNNKNGKATINYTYPKADNVINMLEVVEENINMMRKKNDCEDNSRKMPNEGPIVVLRGPNSHRESQSLHVITRSQAGQIPIVIRGPNSSKLRQSSSKKAPSK